MLLNKTNIIHILFCGCHLGPQIHKICLCRHNCTVVQIHRPIQDGHPPAFIFSSKQDFDLVYFKYNSCWSSPSELSPLQSQKISSLPLNVHLTLLSCLWSWICKIQKSGQDHRINTKSQVQLDFLAAHIALCDLTISKSFRWTALWFTTHSE